jgi:hypothetical protein
MSKISRPYCLSPKDSFELNFVGRLADGSQEKRESAKLGVLDSVSLVGKLIGAAKAKFDGKGMACLAWGTACGPWRIDSTEFHFDPVIGLTLNAKGLTDESGEVGGSQSVKPDTGRGMCIGRKTGVVVNAADYAGDTHGGHFGKKIASIEFGIALHRSVQKMIARVTQGAWIPQLLYRS